MLCPTCGRANADDARFCLGLLATTLSCWDDAARHFTKAIATTERWGAPLFTARAQHAYAEMLVKRGERGDQQQALDLLSQALGTAEEFGMTRLAEQALALKVQVQGILKA